MPRKKEDIVKDGKATQFSKTRRPKNPGRRKSELKDFMSQEKVSLDDFKRMVNEVLLCRSAEELHKIKLDKTNPAIVCLFASVMEVAIKNGRMHDANLIIDRLYGKATEKIDAKVDTNISAINIDCRLTDEEQQVFSDRIKSFMGIDKIDADKDAETK